MDAKNPVFGACEKTKAQTSLRIRTFVIRLLWVSYLNLLQAKFQFLASLCSWAG